MSSLSIEGKVLVFTEKNLIIDGVSYELSTNDYDEKLCSFFGYSLKLLDDMGLDSFPKSISNYCFDAKYYENLKNEVK